ncbi:MAG: DUF4394 domain-containing protein [Acidobacteria bacterium]|nr:DUF4394 domain-containing protein [Acidobacteriota bacterium]
MKHIYNKILLLICLVLCLASVSLAQNTVGRTGRETVFAVTTSNRLFSFNSITPGTISTPVAITGLQSGENILGIDFRPATRTLYAVGSTSRIYVINPTTGAATLVGTGAFSPALTGTRAAVDFNPSPDRIRVVSSAGENLRINPDNGAVVSTPTSDPNVAFDAMDANAGKTPNVFGAAYTNNFAGIGGTTTTLYEIDATLDTLVTQGSFNSAPVSPNSGRLFTVGNLGINVTEVGDIDISDVSGLAFGAFNLMGENFSRFYTVNLATGRASLLGQIGPMGTETVRAISVNPTGENILGATADNRLVLFNATAPNTILASKQLTGIRMGDTILGIDYRPATGQLMAVGMQGTIYNINPTTGVATVVGSPVAAPTGASFGVDFNPAPDRIRFVSNTGQDLRLNPNDGTVAGTDMPLAFDANDPNAGAQPNIVGAAYTNNVAGTPATGTTLYEIDSTVDALVIQGSVNATPVNPNAGTLFTLAPLGVKVTNNVSFDISGTSGIAYAAMTLEGETSTKFFRVALPTVAQTTPVATMVGSGVIGDGTANITAISVVPQVENLFGLTMDNRLVRFNPRLPATLIGAPVSITGLQAGENIVGIDYRPVSGILFGLGSTSRVYTINPASGVATQVGTAPFTPALSGTEFGFDFNPVPDRIRLVSNTGQDLRLNPNNGALAATDGMLRFNMGDANMGQTPNLAGAAYTNNYGGTRATTLYNIDTKLDVLTTQGTTPPVSPVISPNDGIQLTVGRLGIDASDVVGFDISESTNRAYAAIQLTGETSSRFYSINLDTGAATQVGTMPIGGAAPLLLRDITTVSNVNLSVVAVTGATPVIAGNNITYTVVVGNGNSEALSNVVLSTAVPANTTFVSTTAPTGFTCQNPAAGATGAINCTGASLAPNSTSTFVITVRAGGTTSNLMVPLATMVKTDSADISSVRFDNTTSTATAVVNQPGPSIAAAGIKIKNDSIKATISGTVPFSATTLLVNGVGFANAPKFKNNNMVLVQKGKLANGMSIKQALPKGTPATLTFTNNNGGVTVVMVTP